MRHRIYWLLPDPTSARQVMDALLLARIEHRHLHFMARGGVDLSGLHEASALQSSDLISSAQWGLCIGTALGAAAGAVFAVSAVLEESAKPAVVVMLAVIGALFGAWTASLIGSSIPSRRLKRFMPAIEQGEILLMADVPHGRVQDVKVLLDTTYPDAHFEGHEPRVPAFP